VNKNLELIGHSGLEATFRNKRTKEIFTRDLSPNERILVDKSMKEMLKNCTDTHNVWHDFCRKFNAPKGGYKYSGYKFQQRVEEWAKQYPDVKIVTCDDSHHATSILVLIPHKTKQSYMGITVIFIPQFGGDISRSFLYNHNRMNLIKALQSMKPTKPTEKTLDLDVNSKGKLVLKRQFKKIYWD